MAETRKRTLSGYLCVNPRTGVVYAGGDDIAYWPLNAGTIFRTRNFFAAGAATVLAPVLTDKNEAYQITYSQVGTPDAGWGVEQTTIAIGTDVEAHIIEITDTNNDPIRLSGLAGLGCLFTITVTAAAT